MSEKPCAVGLRDRIAYRLMCWCLKIASPQYEAWVRLGMDEALERAIKQSQKS